MTRLALGAAPASTRRLKSIIAALFQKPSSSVGVIIVIVFAFLAIFGPAIAPYGPNEQIAKDALQAPSLKHWFGTDQLGRDIFSRVILGAREVLSLAGLGTLVAIFIGSFIGLLSGYAGGFLDEVIMRIFDSLLALPAMLLALLLLGTLGPSPGGILIVISVVYTPIVARVVRSIVLGTKTKAFVDAARLQGESLGNILFREIFPSTLPALTVEASLRFSYAIFLVSSLGFLGVGVQPPSPDWGLMVKESRAFVTQLPWAMYFPAGAIAVVVIGVNLAADGLRKALQDG